MRGNLIRFIIENDKVFQIEGDYVTSASLSSFGGQKFFLCNRKPDEFDKFHRPRDIFYNSQQASYHLHKKLTQDLVDLHAQVYEKTKLLNEVQIIH